LEYKTSEIGNDCRLISFRHSGKENSHHGRSFKIAFICISFSCRRPGPTALFIPEAKIPIMRQLIGFPETVILFLFYKWKRGIDFLSPKIPPKV
jgi:hypothetical protein